MSHQTQPIRRRSFAPIAAIVNYVAKVMDVKGLDFSGGIGFGENLSHADPRPRTPAKKRREWINGRYVQDGQYRFRRAPGAMRRKHIGGLSLLWRH